MEYYGHVISKNEHVEITTVSNDGSAKLIKIKVLHRNYNEPFNSRHA